MAIEIRYTHPARTKYSTVSSVNTFYHANQGALRKLEEQFPEGNYIFDRKVNFVENYEPETRTYEAATYLYVIPTNNFVELSIGKDNLVKLVFVTPEKRYPLKRTYPIRRGEALWRYLCTLDMLPNHIKTEDRFFVIKFEDTVIRNKVQLLFKLGKYND